MPNLGWFRFWLSPNLVLLETLVSSGLDLIQAYLEIQYYLRWYHVGNVRLELKLPEKDKNEIWWHKWNLRSDILLQHMWHVWCVDLCHLFLSDDPRLRAGLLSISVISTGGNRRTVHHSSVQRGWVRSILLLLGCCYANITPIIGGGTVKQDLQGMVLKIVFHSKISVVCNLVKNKTHFQLQIPE